MRAIAQILTVVLGLAMAPALAQGDIWAQAQTAYDHGDDERGNRLLSELIESQPGDVDLALRCLEKIYDRGDRLNVGSRWMRYVADRVAALERSGAISANAPLFREILSRRLEIRAEDRKLFETAADYDDLAERHPHDLHWQITQARGHQALGLPTTRDLFEDLKLRADTNHPDPWFRDRWDSLSDVLDGDLRRLPQPLLPPAPGSPLVDLEPDDPDGRWQQVAEQPLAKIATQVDRLIGLALLGENTVPWRDMSGLVAPPLALDLHLRTLPAEQLAALRRIQAATFARETVPAKPTPEQALGLFRRYPWADGTHKLLLVAANQELFAGHARSALRSFEDLLAHSANEKVTEFARVGQWAALSILGEREALQTAIAELDPASAMTWLGKATTARELGAQLLAAIPARSPGPSPVPLTELDAKPMRIPPVAPWLGGGHPGSATLDMRVVGDDLLVTSRNHLAIYPTADPSAARWAQTRPPMDDDRNRRALLPGYFRPEVTRGTLYTRWGFRAVPSGIAAFDLASGEAHWLHEGFGSSAGNLRQPHLVPIGDPAVSDGLIYMPLWNSHRAQKVELACIEAATRTTLWRTTIAEAGKASDIIANLEKANQNIRTFGNRVTAYGGAIYVNTNAGLIARCDARDGKPDWLHFYATSPAPATGALGCAPLIAGDLVICMPRDTGRVFALNSKTGRIIWDNPLVLGVESLGLPDGDTLLIRGQTSLAALDLVTGETRWHTPLPRRIVGRVQRVGDSVFIADGGGIAQIDARSGITVATRPWDPVAHRAMSFHIHGGSLFVIGDQPARDRGIALTEPLNPEAPTQNIPLGTNLKRRWSLSRGGAQVLRGAGDSPLADHAFVLSEGILECIAITPQGAVRWRRFVDSHQAIVHVIGERLLLVTGDGKATRHVTAFDGRDGSLVWETDIPKAAGALLDCGGVGLLHDNRTLLVAFDPATGERLWDREVPFGQHTIPHWDGERLHVFQTSMGRAGWHLVIDPKSGRTLAEHDIELARAAGLSTDGTLGENGFYEVTFDPVQARYFRLVMLSEVNGMGWSSAAELHVGGPDGKNLDRSKWRAHYTDSFEPKSRMSTVPENVFDGDRSSWWHSQWLGGIPKHPHELQIDLGATTEFNSLRYLPAVIINSNGMIGEYELYASDDPDKWGQPVAAGTMVKQLLIDRAQFTEAGLVFETRNRRTGRRDIYAYPLDGSQALPLAPSHELIAARGRYIFAQSREPATNDQFVVLRADDPSYRFELGKGFNFDRNNVIIEGDRLCLASHKVILADLASKRFLVAPERENTDHDRHGIIIRASASRLLKFIHSGHRGTEMISIDLASGTLEPSLLAAQTDHVRALTGQHSSPGIGTILLLRDDYGLSAWTSAR